MFKIGRFRSSVEPPGIPLLPTLPTFLAQVRKKYGERSRVIPVYHPFDHSKES